jgi:hypothetical protein
VGVLGARVPSCTTSLTHNLADQYRQESAGAPWSPGIIHAGVVEVVREGCVVEYAAQTPIPASLVLTEAKPEVQGCTSDGTRLPVMYQGHVKIPRLWARVGQGSGADHTSESPAMILCLHPASWRSRVLVSLERDRRPGCANAQKTRCNVGFRPLCQLAAPRSTAASCC